MSNYFSMYFPLLIFSLSRVLNAIITFVNQLLSTITRIALRSHREHLVQIPIGDNDL